MITKNKLDELVLKYETKEFISQDPVRYVHSFKSKRDIEIAGFIASLFAYGNRKVFLSKLDKLIQMMGDSPYKFVLSFTQENSMLDSFEYRFSKGCDIKEIFLILKQLYREEESSLEELFSFGWNKFKTVKGMLITVTDYFYSNVKNEVTKGFYHLIPDANKSSALKRMNMFLRWMVRDGVVDKGVWNFMPKSELLIPLDTHVSRLSVEMGLVAKSNGDFKTAQLITEKLKEFDDFDPIKYDFALFAYGIDK